MYVLPFYANKTLLSFVWFSEIGRCRTTFSRLITSRRKNIHFPSKYRGLGDGYKATITFATPVLTFTEEPEYRNLFSRNYKQAKACRLQIGEKREFKFMWRIPLSKRLLLVWIRIVTLKFKVVWFEHTYHFVSIFKSRFVTRCVASLKKAACVAYS